MSDLRLPILRAVLVAGRLGGQPELRYLAGLDVATKRIRNYARLSLQAAEQAALRGGEGGGA